MALSTSILKESPAEREHLWHEEAQAVISNDKMIDKGTCKNEGMLASTTWIATSRILVYVLALKILNNAECNINATIDDHCV